jgi:excisionase family DNA binding protein
VLSERFKRKDKPQRGDCRECDGILRWRGIRSIRIACHHRSMKSASRPTEGPLGPALSNLLTTEEAAAQLKLAPKTIRALCASRTITAIRVCRRWRIPADELERFKQARMSFAV